MNRLAVVTGASRGLGRAIVDELSRAGWAVIAVVRENPANIEWPDTTTVVVADVGQDAVAPALLAAIGDRPLDLIVNNAAVGAPIVGVESAEVDELLHAVNVNVGGPFRVIKGLLPNLRRAPNPTIVNVSSRLASLTGQARGDFAHVGGSHAYRVSKAAQNMLTIALANELAGQVRCCAVHPGALMTDMALADASKPPEQAARELLELVDSPWEDHPRFFSLGAHDLDW